MLLTQMLGTPCKLKWVPDRLIKAPLYRYRGEMLLHLNLLHLDLLPEAALWPIPV